MSKIVGYTRELRHPGDSLGSARALRRAGAVKVFSDRLSSGVRHRPQFEACLAALGQDDVLVIPDAVSLSPSVDHFVTTVSGLAARGVALRSLREPVLSTDATAREDPVEVLAALNSMRSELAGLRTSRGLDAAAAAGRKPGRPRVMTDEKIAVALELRTHKRSFAQIARSLGVSEAAVRRAMPVQIPQK